MQKIPSTQNFMGILVWSGKTGGMSKHETTLLTTNMLTVPLVLSIWEKHYTTCHTHFLFSLFLTTKQYSANTNVGSQKVTIQNVVNMAVILKVC